MAANPRIEWTHKTFNPWWGCTHASPGCERCYAERIAADKGVRWGVDGDRRIASPGYWLDPLRWHRVALAKGERQRVFCASMADVFDARSDLDAPRAWLWPLIEATPSLDWLLLTKRPQSIAAHVPAAWMCGGFPSNVWIGATVEDQRRADERIPVLREIPAAVRFLSCEPLLESLGDIDLEGIDWVIAGAESGPRARPMSLDWVRELRNACSTQSVSFFFKQKVDPLRGKIGMPELDGRVWGEFPLPKAVRRAA